jgi:uncharacterized protein (TIGR01777 family)
VRIVLAGGSGQIGTVLARAFVADGHEVVVLSRSAGASAQHAWRFARWDGVEQGAWVRELDRADVLINLAGRSVNCRYDARNRDEIMRSRVDSTRALGRALASVERPPSVWLQASTATIYAHGYDQAHDEDSGVLGGDEPDLPDTWRFSLEVARAWEAAADAVQLPATRVVKLRAAMTMSPDRGGVFATLIGLVRAGLGGSVAGGRQYVSWIHEADFVAAVRFLIARSELAGPINLAAPNPLPYADFMRALRDAWGMPIGLPATRWMLELGAFALRTESELVLKSRRVVPGRLLQAGFTFTHPTWQEAATDLCTRYRNTADGNTADGNTADGDGPR